VAVIAQMTLRNIPDAVKKRLASKARKDGHSINRTAVELLQTALGMGVGQTKKRDLSAFSGQWNSEDFHAFEKNSRLFGKIDDEVWSK
jgi:plasmid stability protein